MKKIIRTYLCKKNIWEVKVQHMRDRGRRRKDWNSAVTKIILRRGKTINKVKVEAK